jgi:hypothetical protein
LPKKPENLGLILNGIHESKFNGRHFLTGAPIDSDLSAAALCETLMGIKIVRFTYYYSVF